MAAGSGQTEKVKLFLENGQIDVNHILDSTDHPNNGHTALTLASMNGHNDVVELLLKNEKIDVNQRGGIDDGKKWTALSFASDQGNRAIVELILAKDGVDVNKGDINGWTALMSAVNNGHIEIVKLLLNHGEVDVNKRTNDGGTALMWAKNTDIAKLILDNRGIERSTIEQGCIRGEEAQVKELICQHLTPGKNSDAFNSLFY